MIAISRRRIWVSWLIWTVVAFFTATQLYLRGLSGETVITWWTYLRIQLLVWWVWWLISPLIFYLGAHYRFDQSEWWKSLLVHLPLSVLIVLAYLAFYTLIWNVDQGSVNQGAFFGLYKVLFFNLFHWHFFIYIAIIGYVHAQLYFQELRQQEVNQVRLEKELVVSQLNFLKTQIQPHFLFNTLNSIVSAIKREKPQVASDMITDLSELLRISLSAADRPMTTLRKELEYVESYLRIEKYRFKDLEVSYDVAPELLDEEVPNFLLQPLVENAIKHGISKQSNARVIEIRVRLEEDHLSLEIYNDGPAFRPEREGIGLANVKERIQNIYGQVAGFAIFPEREGTMVQMSFPAG